jgi:hypothetical protein
MSRKTVGQQRLLVGAPALAEYIFGDKKRARKIYTPKLREQLGLFLLAGQIVGRPATIDQRISEAEKKAAEKASAI